MSIINYYQNFKYNYLYVYNFYITMLKYCKL